MYARPTVESLLAEASLSGSVDTADLVSFVSLVSRVISFRILFYLNLCCVQILKPSTAYSGLYGLD